MTDFDYKGWGLHDAIGALKAYDSGCRDSGVNDDDMKAAVRSHLHGLPSRDLDIILARFVRRYVSREGISQGYGIEDVAAFLRWLDREMGIAL